MDPNTGRIQAIYTEEDEQDARDNGLIPLTEAQTAEVGPMSRKQRIDWAAERQALATTHHALHGGKARNQRKRERQSRGRRGRT